MKYSIDWLLEKYNKKEKIEYLFFWGHRKKKEISKSVFSQWWIREFVVDNIKYSSMEKFMMAEKARLFEDKEILDTILKNNDPMQVKALGRKVKNFDNDIWNKNKYEIVKQGNLEKFSQNRDLKEFLLNTADKIIVEASPYDKIWGIGLKEDAEGIDNPYKWRGENLLGFALMEVRDEIKKINQECIINN